MRDRYGVPETLFGPVPDDFYALVGRIALVATFLEDRLLELLWALDNQPHPIHAGRPASQLKIEIESRLTDRESALGGAFVSDLKDLLSATESALERRHALVHSLWPNPTSELAQGWRSRRLPKSLGGGSEIVWTETSVDALAEDLKNLVELADSVRRRSSHVHSIRDW